MDFSSTKGSGKDGKNVDVGPLGQVRKKSIISQSYMENFKKIKTKTTQTNWKWVLGARCKWSHSSKNFCEENDMLVM